MDLLVLKLANFCRLFSQTWEHSKAMEFQYTTKKHLALILRPSINETITGRIINNEQSRISFLVIVNR